MKIGKICASVSAETCSDAVGRIREAEDLADIIEVRFDHLRADELPLLLKYLKENEIAKPMIATLRPLAQGGRSALSAEARAEFWEDLDGHFWAVDLEEDVFDAAKDILSRIVSFHEFDSTVSDVKKIFERLSSRRPSVVKYAYSADDITDTLPVWKLLTRAEKLAQPTVAIAMGEAGKITRILGPAYGSQWTYGSLAVETAPGQISVNDLVNLYRVPHLNRETRVYGVIGDPVSKSRSPRIHNAAFAEAGLNSVFVPILVNDLGSFIERMVAGPMREIDLNFGGFSVTMPHKISIMKYLDEVDETASIIGAVNTIHIDGGQMIGYNTDADGFISPLLARFETVNGLRAAVFGAGGAARACVFALTRNGASVTVFARDASKAAEMVRPFDADSDKIGNEDLGSFDIVVNATPVGMTDKNVPFSLAGLGSVSLVYDLVTSAEPTLLIRAAENAAVRSVTGVEMLAAQAVKQFEIWTGMPAPVEIMNKAAELPG